MPQPFVAVVILSWNGKHLLEQFLPSVVTTPYPNMKVIVADNASMDNTASWLAQTHPTVQWLPLERNFGFAQGYNKAIEQIDAEYIVLLNQDVETEDDWITPLVNILENNPHVAAVQPKIKSYNEKNKFEYAGAAGGYMDRYGYPFCRGRIFNATEIDNGQYDMPASIAWASGACMLTRRSLYMLAGGLDADLFAHMEEIDLCWRFKNMGYDVTCEPAATVYHLGGGSLPQGHPKKVYLNFRNNLALLAKNYNLGSLGMLLFVRFWLDGLAAMQFLLKGQLKHAAAVARAVYRFYKHFANWKRKRDVLKKSWQTHDRQGFYRHSILWDYFARRARTFKALRW